MHRVQTKKIEKKASRHGNTVGTARTYIRRAARSTIPPLVIKAVRMSSAMDLGNPGTFIVPEGIVIVFLSKHSGPYIIQNVLKKYLEQKTNTYSVAYVAGDTTPNFMLHEPRIIDGNSQRRFTQRRIVTLHDIVGMEKQGILRQNRMLRDDISVLYIAADTLHVPTPENMRKIMAMHRNASERAGARHHMPVTKHEFENWMRRAHLSRNRMVVDVHGRLYPQEAFIVPHHTAIMFTTLPGCIAYSNNFSNVIMNNGTSPNIFEAYLRHQHPIRYSASYLENDMCIEHMLTFDSGSTITHQNGKAAVTNFNGKRAKLSEVVNHLTDLVRPTEKDPLVLFINCCRVFFTTGNNTAYPVCAACDEVTCERAGASRRPSRNSLSETRNLSGRLLGSHIKSRQSLIFQHIFGNSYNKNENSFTNKNLRNWVLQRGEQNQFPHLFPPPS